MKKIQRILALAGVVLLLALYGATMVFALSDSPASEGWFKASIFCTIAVPVVLYAYILILMRLPMKSRFDGRMRRWGKRSLCCLILLTGFGK